MRNSVTFKSSAPLEDIVGTTNQITGMIMFDPENPEKGASGELTVPVASLSSGIPLRDEHLQSPDWLDAARYPDITLTITGIQDLKKVKSTKDAKTYDLTLIGELFLHGKSKRVEIPGRFSYLNETEMTQQKLPGDLLAARANFEVKLKDFGITGPKGMPLVGSKVGESIALDVSFVASSQATDMEHADNPCGGKEGMNASNPCGGKHDMGAENPCGGKKSMEAGNPCGGKSYK
jgi:polyisoprenoid-binding protein YceI